ncbi:MAG: ABC-type multidrug transport system fused ATPase/permease subunit [Gammaproteobacteria bacterium]
MACGFHSVYSAPAKHLRYRLSYAALMFIDKRLWQMTHGVRGRIAFAVLVGVLAATVGVARLALLGWLLGLVYQGASLAELVTPIVFIAAVMVLRGVLEYARTMLAHHTAARVQLALREQLFNQVVSLGPAYFGLTRTGDVLLSLVEGVERLEIYFGQFLPQLFVAAITPLVVFVLLAFFDLPLAAMLLAFAWVTMLAPAMFQKWDSTASMRRRDAYKAFAGEFLDAIQGLATLKAFGQSRSRGLLLAERAHEVFRSTMWVLATNSLTRGITDTGIAVGAAATLAVGAYRVTEGQTSIAVLLMVLMAGVETFRPQRDLRTMLHDGMVGLSAAEGIFELLDAKPVVRWEGTIDSTADASVRFENVGFQYPGGRAAAHVGLDFSLANGERIGFVGSSGAGKSTIVKLLLRFHDTTQGRVLVGGVDVRDLTPDALYNNVAVVSQDTYLFHGTVEQNLRFGKPNATQHELEQAAREANAHEFIERLPQGYRTVIGERGVRLSGGQRQRVAIARALLRDAPILVLDEALSAVDAENEAVIQQALNRLMTGRTTLVFAHRLSSVIDCDRILVLKEGRVVEQGSHRELLKLRGDYHRLMASQVGHGGDSPVDALLDATGTLDSLLNVSLGPIDPGAIDPQAVDPQAMADGALADALNGADQALDVDDDILRSADLGWGGVLRELMHYVAPWKSRLVMTFAFGVSRVLAFISVGIISALVVAAVKQGDPFTDWLIWLAVLAPLAGVLHWLESWVAHDMAFRMLAQMRVDLFTKLDALAPAFLVRRRSGDLVAMATHDVELVEYFFAHTIAPAFVAVLIPSVVVAVLWHFGALLALALLPFLLVVALSPFMFRTRIDELGSQARESLAELNAHVVDSVQGLHEIAAFQQVEHRKAGFMHIAREHLKLRMPFFVNLTWQHAALEIAIGLGGLAVVTTGAWLVQNGDLPAALLPLLTLLALSSFLPVSEIAHVGRQLADTLGATRRLHAVHGHDVAVRDGPGVPLGSTEVSPGSPALSLEHVSFRYDGQHVDALSDASFDVLAGDTIALVGPSGAGKTTVAHLMLRFWDVAAGSVRLHGHDLRDFSLEELRARIALVSQDTYLFNESLRKNIAMARPQASEAELMQAIERAALTEFVSALPEGLDTSVGERGMRLSGGQRQRVAIARAFLKDAPVLILDEATSHLDAVSEAAVRHALEQLMSDRTTVVIAHRLSTVRNADRIVVLDQGRVIESGNHEQLLERGGMYRQLVARQLGL